LLPTPPAKVPGSRSPRPPSCVETAHPDKIAFANMKLMDTSELEAEIVFSGRADPASVLGSAQDPAVATKELRV
jgi:3-keto-L-gulonate-6-phosphate decarboxylase